MSGIRIFVTGGSGFIGTHLCKCLRKVGHKVTNYDIANNKKDDIRILRRLCERSKNHDVIIHLAAISDINISIKKPELTYNTNVKGTENVLNAAMINKIPKIIFASSAAVYDVKSSPYAQSKSQGEAILQDGLPNIDCIALRLFNVYGRNGRSAICRFINAALGNSCLTIYGSGYQSRDYIYIDDICDAFLKALKCKLSICIDIGTGISLSVLDVARKVMKTLKKDLPIKHDYDKIGGTSHSIADIYPAVRYLDFAAKYHLEEGIRKMMK